MDEFEKNLFLDKYYSFDTEKGEIVILNKYLSQYDQIISK